MDDQWAFRGDTWPACNFHCVSLHTGASTEGHDVKESSREFETHIRGPDGVCSVVAGAYSEWIECGLRYGFKDVTGAWKARRR